MKKFLLLLTLLFLGSVAGGGDGFITNEGTSLSQAVAAAAPAAKAAPVRTEVAKYAASLVRIRTIITRVDKDGKTRTYACGGTGFAVTPSIIWTAAHVVDIEKGDTLVKRFVILQDGTIIPIVSSRTLTGDAAEASLAAPHGLPCLKVASISPAKQVPAVVLGFPGSLPTWVSGQGHAAKVKMAPFWLPRVGVLFLEITMPLRKGMSGGPLLVGGEVVAVVSCKGPTFPGLDDRYFCARCDRAAVLLQEAADAALQPPSKPKPDPRPAPRPKAPVEAPGAPKDDCPDGT